MTIIFSANHSVIMDKLKDTVLRVANSDPNNPLSPSQISFIQKQLLLAFPVFQTPTHPTYSAMIQDAIKELNEEHGSNEESISEFIKAKYEGLPWAHNMYLTHHLCKLCESGEIVCNSTSKCYSMPEWAGTQVGDSRKKQRKRRLVRKRKEGVNKEGDLVGKKVAEESGDLNGVQEEGIEEFGRNEHEEGGVSGEKVVEVSGNLIGFQEEDIEEFGRSRSKPRRRSLVFVEENDEVARIAVDEGEQDLAVKRCNELLAWEDGDGDTRDAARFMHVPAESVEQSHVTLITSSVSNVKDDKDPELAVKESGLKGSNIPIAVKIKKGHSKKKQPKRKLEDEEGNLSGEEVLEVCGTVIGSQEEEIQEIGRCRLKPRRQSLLVDDEDDKAVRTVVDRAEENLVAEGHNKVIAREDGDDDTNAAVELTSVPAECVEESPVTVIIPSVSNIRGDNDSELAGKVSGLKEGELMIVPFEGNTSISAASAELNSTSDAAARMLVCGLAVNTEQKQLVCKNSPKKRLKGCKQEKKKVSLELISPSSELAVVPNSPRRRLSAGCGKLEISQEHGWLQELLSRRALDTKASGIESQMGPAWLVPMLNGQYFYPCSVDVDSARNRCNLFCLDCMGTAFCFRCWLRRLHRGHRVVQIRRSSGYNVVKVDDIKRHLDISGIQTYIINSAEIVFFNPRPNPKPAKGSPCCENCCRALIDPFRFCCLCCKLCAALCESTKFEESPIDQSEHPRTSCLLEDGSIEQMERENNSAPSYLISQKDSILVEVEEDLPLQKVLEKCSKRKKQAEVKMTADTPLATEATSPSGSKSQVVDLPISECSKQQVGDKERQNQSDVGHDVVEVPMVTSVEEDVPTSDEKCEEPPKQSEADSVNLQSKNLKVGFQGKLRTKMGVTKYGTKQLKKAGRGRPRKKMAATKEGVASSSNLPVDQQEGLCDPATNQHSHKLMNPGKKKGRGRPRKYLIVDHNDAAVSLNSEIQHQSESSAPATDDVVHGRKRIKEGRGRPRKKKQEVNKEDSAIQLELAHKMEEKDGCLEKSQSEAQETQEGGQAMPSSVDDTHKRMMTQNLDGGDQSDHKQEEEESDECVAKQEKFAVEGHTRHPKDKSGKSTSIQVPLSSIDHLRSRKKNQFQDTT